jgi:hypothetical protein
MKICACVHMQTNVMVAVMCLHIPKHVLVSIRRQMLRLLSCVYIYQNMCWCPYEDKCYGYCHVSTHTKTCAGVHKETNVMVTVMCLHIPKHVLVSTRRQMLRLLSCVYIYQNMCWCPYEDKCYGYCHVSTYTKTSARVPKEKNVTVTVMCLHIPKHVLVSVRRQMLRLLSCVYIYQNMCSCS